MSEVNVNIEIESIEIVANVKIGDGNGKLSLVKLDYEDIKKFFSNQIGDQPKAGKSNFHQKMEDILKTRAQ